MIASDNEIRNFLLNPGKIAIVGASTNLSKAGNYVPLFLQGHGFEIIPVNPNVEELFGEKTVDNLEDIQEHVEGVIIYRRPEIAGEIAILAIDLGIPLIWLPLNVTSEKARLYAENKNVVYIENRCPKIEWPRLIKK